MIKRIFVVGTAMFVALSFNAFAEEAAGGATQAEATAPAPVDSAAAGDAAAPQAGEAQKDGNDAAK